MPSKIKGPGSTFIKQRKRALHYVELIEWEWQFKHGKYQGQMNEDNQPHGYGHWSSPNQQAFGDWIMGELYLGSIHTTNEAVRDINKTNEKLEVKHYNLI